MSSNEVAIRVEALSKCYFIYNQPQDRLKQSVIPRLQRLVGKPPKFYYREFWALRNISFEVNRGETIGIIGRNGSGKSTLLQLICRTLNPTSGTVETNGRIAALLELGSGFNPEFTGRENVYLNGAVLGLSTDEINARFDDIAAFADIGDFIEQPIKMYSSGMVLRLAFAVQAMVDPNILIVDEALAVGDERFQRKCFARIEELKSNGTSILFVSHSGPQIVELCERALLLEHGERLLYTDPTRAVNAYQKLIYAPQDQQVNLIQEYKIEDESNVVTDNANLKSIGMSISNRETGNESSFAAELVPQTTVVYPIQGAEIISFRIMDKDGKDVNVLTFGEVYCFEVSGKFLANRERVFFGLYIRTVSGLKITGQRYPEEGNFIEKVLAGEHFRIEYNFKMVLSPGTYFSGGGVWSTEEPNCLHRITDALMFRVTPESKTNSLGYVDISSQKPTIDIALP